MLLYPSNANGYRILATNKALRQCAVSYPSLEQLDKGYVAGLLLICFDGKLYSYNESIDENEKY